MQRPRELGDQDALLALSPVAQERDNWSGLNGQGHGETPPPHSEDI